MITSSNKPFFQPFEGRDYRNPKTFPGRLLVVGESHYVTEEDKYPEFTKRLMERLIQDGLHFGFKTPYFRNVFYILTGKRSRDVDEEKWRSVWNSIAFYNYVQSIRLTRPLMRPTREEWEQARQPFQTVLSQLQPQLILITGAHVCCQVLAATSAREREGRPGVGFPTGSNAYPGVYHPSNPPL